MVEKDRIIKLTNRDTGFAGYTVPDLGIHRSFSPGETKDITFDELERLSWTSGGKELLRDFLVINDREAAEEILGSVEPEYFFTVETIKELLKNGTDEQLIDALNFAPKGVIELIKQVAVETKLNSNSKRELIEKYTHFNVSRSIDLLKVSPEEAKNEQENTNNGGRISKPFTVKEEKTGSHSRQANQNFKVLK